MHRNIHGQLEALFSPISAHRLEIFLRRFFLQFTETDTILFDFDFQFLTAIMFGQTFASNSSAARSGFHPESPVSPHAAPLVGAPPPPRKSRVALACKRCKRRKQRVRDSALLLACSVLMEAEIVRWRPSQLQVMRQGQCAVCVRENTETALPRRKIVVHQCFGRAHRVP